MSPPFEYDRRVRACVKKLNYMESFINLQEVFPLMPKLPTGLDRGSEERQSRVLAVDLSARIGG